MKKTLLVLFSTFTFSISGYSQTPDILQKDFKVSLEWLEEKPQSYAKDFFIIQYLNQDNISIDEAKKAFDMGQKKNSLVKKAFNKKFKASVPSEDLKCYRYSINELLSEKDSRCVALGLSLKEASNLTKEQLDKFISKLDKYPTLKNDLQILRNDNISNENIPYGYDKFFDFFFDLGSSFREKKYNKLYSKEFINNLSNQKEFEKFVRYVIYDEDMFQNIQKSLLNIEESNNLTPNALFLLGLNAINHNNDNKAFYFFDKSFKKAYLKEEKDKALFWLYLVTENEMFLYELSKSWDINIYSLYAKEFFEIPIDNIVYNLEQPNTKSSYDIFDQFAWIDILDDTKKGFDEAKLQKYKALFTDETTLPHLAYVLERFYSYKKDFYITPYKDILKNYPTYKKILIYSIGKQESRFIPSSISVSTAQGVMQIMPFLSEDIAQKLNQPYNIYEQFTPQKNIEFASFHLDTLIKQFDSNPLFIAYAYNGGAGYARSQFKKGLFKRIDKQYEPFLSMEMISYPETKEYGKKVLTNYYIYNNLLNPDDKIRLSTIFQTLVWQN